MRSKLFKWGFGFGLGVFLFAVAMGVDAANCGDSAEGVGGGSCTDVTLEDDIQISTTVGDVEVPVYSVSISWGDMKFDWSYNSITEKYEWTNAKGSYCGHASNASAAGDNLASEFDEFSVYYSKIYTEEEFNKLKEAGQIYSDNTCSNVVTDIDYSELNLYYTIQEDRSKSAVLVLDSSQNGSIVPTISWNSSANYDWTNGILKYLYVNHECAEISSEEEFEELKNKGLVYTSNSCSTIANSSASYDDGNTYFKMETNGGTSILENGQQAPENARIFEGCYYDPNAEDEGGCSYGYRMLLDLEVDESKEIITPKAGDMIGTITISVAARS